MASAPADRPNVLFLFTDDQRFDTLGALGNPQIHTPNLDRLVERGTAFTRAYIMGGSSGAVCMPSRAMLHTGRTLYHLDRQGQDVPAEHVLLGEHLRRAGYATFGTGKWHNGPAAYARSFSAGAEIFFGGMNDHWNVPACDFDPAGRYPEPKPLRMRWGERRFTADVRYDHIASGQHSSELFADATIRLLESQDSDAPFFAYVSFMAPHDPREMPAEYLSMYDPNELDLAPSMLPEHPFDNGELRIRDELLAGFPRTEEQVRSHLADYYAMITHTDAQIGRILNALDRTGRADRTLVVFSGDNGLAVGRHGLMGKQNLYEHSIHVPLVFAGPGVPRGERRDGFCYLLDIYPTLCDFLDLERPETVEGRSLVPAMCDAGGPVRDTLLFAYRHFQRAARDERHKLIEYVVDGERRTQLFDLETDPHETHDLSSDPTMAAHVERLREEVRRWPDELDDRQPGQGEAFWAGFGR